MKSTSNLFELKLLKNRLFKNKKINYLFLLFLILVLAATLRLYNVGVPDFWMDEYQTFATGYGFFKTGEFYTWDFLNDAKGQPYFRAWPHSVLLGVSFFLLGLSEFSARIISVIFGLILIAVVYAFVKDILKKKDLALISALFFSVHPLFLELSRYTRMYAIFFPFFLIFIYYSYKFIETSDFSSKQFELNYFYAFLAGLSFLIGVSLHIVMLLSLIGIYLYLIFNFVYYKNKSNSNYKKYFFFGILFNLTFLFIGIGNLLFGLFSEIFVFLSLVLPPHTDYLILIFYPFNFLVGALAVIIALYYFLLVKKSKPFLFVFFIFLAQLVFFVFFADRYYSVRYIANASILVFIIGLSGVLMLAKFLLKPRFNAAVIVSLLLLLMPFTVFSNNYDAIIRFPSDLSNFGKFNKAYKEIRENYSSDKIIIGQYLRDYYLNSLSLKEKINYVDMKNFKKFTFEEFLAAVDDYDSGWVIWASINGNVHVRDEIKNYALQNFVHLHGEYGEIIDDTNVEVFYFEK